MADEQQAPVVEISNIGGNCPVQAEGTIDGWPFYFRARGEHWSLEVAEPGFEACGEAVWRHEEEYGGPQFAAGWMEQDEARGFIAKAAPLFVAWRVANPAVDGGGGTTARMLRQELAAAYERVGEETQGRLAAERQVVRAWKLLGLNPRDGFTIAYLQVENGVT